MQVLKTAQELRRKGCEVDLSLELTPDLRGYDLVHLFNLTRPQECTIQAVNARRQGKPVVLSTIYLPVEEYENFGRRGMTGLLGSSVGQSNREYLKVWARAVLNGEWNRGVRRLLTRGYRRSQQELLRLTDVLLPNSQSELDRVHRVFPESRRMASVIVPNGIDPELYVSTTIDTREFELFRDCIVCAARIEGRKNQINLVRAMRGLPYRLVLVGKAAPNHQEYLKQVLKESGSNVSYLGGMSPEELVPLYHVARVHALVSWGETTGLSSLEAAACCCNLVITDKGDTRDYFGDFAWYCDPSSVSSIRAAIRGAFEAPWDRRFQQHVLENFTWSRAAETTLEGYGIALAQSHARVIPIDESQPVGHFQ